MKGMVDMKTRDWTWMLGTTLGLLLLVGCPADDDDTADDDAGDDDAGDDDDSAPAMPCDDLCVNEFMASNASTYPDESAAFPDWIELYNPGNADIDLDGYTITDDLGTPGKHVMAAGVVVPAGGWMLLFADNDITDGDQHLGFNLDMDGEDIGLYDPAGDTLDEIEYDQQETDISRSRDTDGGSSWITETAPTPWDSNE